MRVEALAGGGNIVFLTFNRQERAVDGRKVDALAAPFKRAFGKAVLLENSEAVFVHFCEQIGPAVIFLVKSISFAEVFAILCSTGGIIEQVYVSLAKCSGAFSHLNPSI